MKGGKGSREEGSRERKERGQGGRGRTRGSGFAKVRGLTFTSPTIRGHPSTDCRRPRVPGRPSPTLKDLRVPAKNIGWGVGDVGTSTVDVGDPLAGTRGETPSPGVLSRTLRYLRLEPGWGTNEVSRPRPKRVHLVDGTPVEAGTPSPSRETHPVSKRHFPCVFLRRRVALPRRRRTQLPRGGGSH